MLTKIEINGFKTFENFSLDLRPLTAIVGPNASGKSNLFDAIRFLSLLAQNDIFTAMQSLRGLPEELFRRTPNGSVKRMTLAVEMLLGRNGQDTFGTGYRLRTQRVRYELTLDLATDRIGMPRAVIVTSEHCEAIPKKDDSAVWISNLPLSYSGQLSPFIRRNSSRNGLEIRQDGPNKRGNPVTIPLKDTPRTALSTISTAEFPHLYAVKQYLTSITFLELNPSAARNPNDRFEERELRSDASNLSSVLARLKEETADKKKPLGVLADISADLSSLIPSVKTIKSHDDIFQRQFSFGLQLHDGNQYSSRVISDGTLRLLALLTVLNDPKRQGTLCFEEPENGVHEGRMALLVDILRHATSVNTDNPFGLFQILVNTHSPAVMSNLTDDEIVAADLVTFIHHPSKVRSKRTRMRSGVAPTSDLYNPEKYLTRAEIASLLQRASDAA